MPDRIADVIDPNYLIPVEVIRDWAAASNCAADVFVATGLPIAGDGGTMNLDAHLHLWEGPDDNDDYACVQVTAAGATAYKDMDANACDWSTRPAKGQVAYLIGVTFVK
jgi:hypothetical protein